MRLAAATLSVGYNEVEQGAEHSRRKAGDARSQLFTAFQVFSE